MALAVYLLTDRLEGRAVSVSRWAIGVFAVFFSAYDAAAGIGTGYALRNARGLSAGAQEAIYEAVKDMPVLSLIFGLSVVGSLAWWWLWSPRRWLCGAQGRPEAPSSC